MAESKLKKDDIVEIVNLVEDFTAKVLCPKIEAAGGAESTKELYGNLAAALETASMCVRTGATRYVKHKGKYVKLDPGDDVPDDEPEEKQEEEERPDDDFDSFADEISNLIKEIVEVSKKHAKGDRDDFNSSLASTALTIIECGGKGTRIAALIGLQAILTGKIGR